VVPQPVTVDVPAVAAHLHGARGLHQLFVVTPGEFFTGPFGRLVGFTTEHGGASPCR
jgi:hypothetical protein